MFKFFLIASLVAFAAANAPASSDDAHAEVTHLESDVRADGFRTLYDLSNGAHHDAAGDEHGNIHGSYEYISPEGEHIKVTYVADENGYQPASDVLPTPHPIPQAIVKALEYIKDHPSKEEYHH